MPMKQQRVIREIQLDTYEAFVSQSSTATPFHSISWLRVLEAGFPVSISTVGLYSRDGQLFGVCPITFRRVIGPIRIAGSPLPQTFTPYQGLLTVGQIPNNERHEIVREVYSSLKVPYGFSKWLPYGDCDESCTGQGCSYTAVVDTSQPEERLFVGMSRSTRDKVIQARKRGTRVEYVDSPGEWIDDYVRLSDLTYARQGLRSPMRRSFIETLFRHSIEKAPSQCTGDSIGVFPANARQVAENVGWRAGAALVLHEKDIIAASLFVFDDTSIYCLDSVSDRSRQSLRPNNARIWQMMLWASNGGFSRIDLVGANIPGIATFKMGFGAERKRVCGVTHMSRVGEIMYRVRRAGIELARTIRKAGTA